MIPFNRLQLYDKFYINNHLCFKLDEERYISPKGTHRVGDKRARVQTVPRSTKRSPLFRREDQV